MNNIFRLADPFISVIIPTYNRAYVLERAIQSVLNQNYGNYELIVVDDCSQDNTSGLLKRYESHIKVIRHTFHSGVSAARNNGILSAKGTYIALLDSDDEWLPNKLLSQVEYLRRHPKFKILQTEEIWIRNGIRVNPKKKHSKPEGYIFKQSLPLCVISPSSVLIHRKVFEKTGLFDVTFPACEDYELWLRITCRYPVGLVKTQEIIKYGGHEDQLSSTVPRLDRWRIMALLKIAGDLVLNHQELYYTWREIYNKARIYCQGCKKHNRLQECQYFEDILQLAKEKLKKLKEPLSRGD